MFSTTQQTIDNDNRRRQDGYQDDEDKSKGVTGSTIKEDKALGRHSNPQETGTRKSIGVEGTGTDYLDGIRIRMEQMYKAILELAEQNTILVSKLKGADQRNITWQAHTPDDSDGKGSYVGKEAELIAALKLSKTEAEDEARRLRDANATLDVKLAEVERKSELVMQVLVAVVAVFVLAIAIAFRR